MIIAGTQLGPYKISSAIGAGGMGEVYRAHDGRLNREVAVKVLPEYFASNPERLRRFEQEARAAAALNHPNILAVYDVGTNNGSPYLVTELLEGESLRNALRHGAMPVRKAVDIAAQVARGLAAAHQRGIIHRDLKPENLFFTKDGRAKILDFGLAKMAPVSAAVVGQMSTATFESESGTMLGTVGYISPEQVRGREADHRSDIFAFGVVVYELLTGNRAFARDSSAETLSAILKEEPSPISQFAPAAPPALQRVVQRCLEKQPEQRFQSASDLAFALEALSDSDIVPIASHNIPGSRRVWIATAIAVLLLATAITIAFIAARPAAVPTVSNFVQLTRDGGMKDIIGTDGSRLYLYLFNDGRKLAEISVSGGELRPMSALPSPNMFAWTLSPDGTKFLVVDGKGNPPNGPFWSVPVLGGSARRLGGSEGQDAAWSPDGLSLAYTDGPDLFVATGDGTSPRKLASLNSTHFLDAPNWSPDGARLSFRESSGAGPARLWEVAVDGKGLHQLLPESFPYPVLTSGSGWSPDGKYFLFITDGQIWAIPRSGGLFRKPSPIRLTSTPLSLRDTIFSKDGTKVFVVGYDRRGQLERYDFSSRQFQPFLGGISAEFVTFSRDGQWAAYVSYPEGTLWRSRVDGSERMQLTYPSGQIILPRWSPDGKKIAFGEVFIDRPWRVFSISTEGGSPEPLIPNDPHSQSDPDWSPDGSRILFGGSAFDSDSDLRILDLKTHQVEIIPESQHLFSPRWSPDGRYIAALSMNAARLLLFDFQTQRWSQIGNGDLLGWIEWSNDGQYLVYADQSQGVLRRLRMRDRKAELLVDFANFRTTGYWNFSMTLAPDGSPLLLRNIGTQDVYSIDWREP